MLFLKETIVGCKINNDVKGKVIVYHFLCTIHLNILIYMNPQLLYPSVIYPSQPLFSLKHWSPHLSVTALWMGGGGEKATRAFLQPLMHWSYWAGKRGCIDFDLNWATFMVNFTRAASSTLHFTPSHLAEGKWDSFSTWGSTSVWRPHTRSHSNMTWYCLFRMDTVTCTHRVDLVVQFQWRPQVKVLPF